jgi:asparagine synthase (glutamine-hydrolysing)
MGQVFGLTGIHDAAELRRVLGRMGDVMRRASQPAPLLWMDPAEGVGLGVVPDVSPSEGADESRETAGQLSVPGVIDGLFYRGAHAGSVEPAAGVLSDYTLQGPRLLESLDGSFCLALWIRSEKQLIVANDRFSTRTLYWTESAGRLVFASELKALLMVPGITIQLDPSAMAQCAGFNRILGDRTLVRQVSRLPGAAILEWNQASGSRLRRYWQMDEVVAERTPLTDARRDAVVEAFRDAVRVRTASAGPLGLSLSGGLDSRAIAAVLGSDGIRAHSCTTGFAGSADQRLAAQVSAVAGTRHHFFELQKDVIATYPQALRHAAFVRDELLLFGGFPGRLTEQFCAATGTRTLLRGHGGENLKLAEAWPFQVTPAVAAMRRPEELRPHLRRVLASCPADVDLDPLLGMERGGAAAALDSAIEEAIGGHGSLSAAEVMSTLYLVQNDGREVPLTRNGLRGVADMAVPFIDYPLLDLVLATRVQDRRDVSLHVAILRRLSPRMLRIGNSNTGAPVDASPLRLFATDKANTLLKRLRVPGFRHYHYMDEWLQGFLAEQVRAIVLDERTLTRGMFHRDVLTALMERARSDRRMSRLVNFVMNVEIWCRLFVDGEGFQADSAARVE